MKKHVEPTGEIRPTCLAEYVGQAALKPSLERALQGARGRSEALDHMLLYGPPGLGKTSLAGIVAHEMGGPLVTTSSSALQQATTLLNTLRNLKPLSTLFIDEIHRLPIKIEEVLYPAMEDGRISASLGVGAYARTWTQDLPPFTLIGATTHLSRVSEPLRDRFGLTYRLEYYSEEELCGIVSRAARVRGLEIARDACMLLAARSKGTARVADRLVRRVRDYATKGIGMPEVTACMADLGIDEWGLNAVDRKVLTAVIDKYGGGPVGLITLADEAGEDQETIQDVYEPYLMRIDFLTRTPRGRVVTQAARDYIASR